MKTVPLLIIAAIVAALVALSATGVWATGLLLVTAIALGLVVGTTLLRAPLLALLFIAFVLGVLSLGHKYLGIDMVEYTQQSGHANLVAIALVVCTLLGVTFSRRA